MVTENPLYRGGMSLKKFNATVVNDIIPELVFFTLVATMVTLVSELTKHQLSVNNGMLSVLGTVLGLVISFRTSSAYERYQEGRKLWTAIQITSRNVAQLIWIHIPDDRSDYPKYKHQTLLQNIIEKKSMVNLVQAFSVALKHFLRGENGVYYEDLYPLIGFLPRYATVSPRTGTNDELLPLWQASEDGQHPYDHGISHMGPSRSNSAPSALGKEDTTSSNTGSWLRRKATFYDPEKTLPTLASHRPLHPARNPPKTSAYDVLPFLYLFKPIVTLFKKSSSTKRNRFGRKIKPQLGDSNVPVEITLFLSSYANWAIRAGFLVPATASSLIASISSLQDSLTNLERIATTPLPFAYQAHLRMSLYLYLFFLPFQIWSSFHYLTIPGTAFASFLFLGFLEIGQEIENPFNYDLNDLDLDTFCLEIQRELHEITAHTCPTPDQFVFSGWNQPFAPADRRTAEDLIASPEYVHQDSEAGMGSIRKMMLNNWKHVDEFARRE